MWRVKMMFSGDHDLMVKDFFTLKGAALEARFLRLMGLTAEVVKIP